MLHRCQVARARWRWWSCRATCCTTAWARRCSTGSRERWETGSSPLGAPARCTPAPFSQQYPVCPLYFESSTCDAKMPTDIAISTILNLIFLMLATCTMWIHAWVQVRWTDAGLPKRLCVRVQEAGWLWSGGVALDSPGDLFVKIRHRCAPPLPHVIPKNINVVLRSVHRELLHPQASHR